jgi:hypothetical protein
MKKGLATVLVAAIMAAMFVLPADARPKKQKRPNAQKRAIAGRPHYGPDSGPAGLTRFHTTDWGFRTAPYCH